MGGICLNSKNVSGEGLSHTQVAYTGSINYDVLNLLVNESGLLHPYFGQSIRETLGQRAGLGLPPSTV